MVLRLQEEQKLVLDVQAAYKLSKSNKNLSEENQKILRVGKKANKILTDENLYLIVQETKKFYPYQTISSHFRYSIEHAEYIHEGVLGLHQAIIRFEVARGFRLNSFAISWIRGSISRLRKQKANAKISYEQAEKYNLTHQYNQEVTSISSQEFEFIQKFVNALNPIDRDIVNRCFGLNNYPKNSLIAIGRCNNLSPKQVARRRDIILKRLRYLLHDKDKKEQNKALLHCLNNDICLLAS